MMRRGWSAEEKLAVWSWPEDERGCIEWVGATNGKGYGKVRLAGVKCAAHRVAYELVKGPIPQHYEIDHLCRNPACVNPGHLEAVTKRVNVLRGFGACAQHARKTHCKQGHPFSGANLFIRADGARGCRKCAADRAARDRIYPEGAPRGRVSHCRHGHPYDAANTYWRDGERRQCRACNRAAVARHKMQKAANGIGAAP